MTTPDTAAGTGRSTIQSAAIAVVVAAVAASIVNVVISLIARALGADPAVFMGLTPVMFVPATVIGIIAGVIGWTIVRRRAARPEAVLTWLVPVVVAVTLLSDVAVGVSLGWGGALALGLMHLAVAAIAVPVFRKFLPLAG